MNDLVRYAQLCEGGHKNASRLCVVVILLNLFFLSFSHKHENESKTWSKRQIVE